MMNVKECVLVGDEVWSGNGQLFQADGDGMEDTRDEGDGSDARRDLVLAEAARSGRFSRRGAR